MEEYSSLPGATQTYENQQETLRGYDPRREIAHWNQIIFLLFVGVLLVNFFLMQELESVDTLTHTAQFWELLGPILALPVVGIGLSVLSLRGFWQEQRKSKLLRQAALRGELQAGKQKLSILPSPTFLEGLPLSLVIESHVKRASIARASIGIASVSILLVLGYVLTANMLTIPEMLGAFAILPVVGIFIPAMFVFRLVITLAASYYLLPALRVDADGIRARYGRDTLVIHWRDIRYFALVTTPPTEFSSRPASASVYKQNEAFEISDGENMICWQAAWPSSTYDLRLSGEIPLSREEYNTFTAQLAALVAERTRLPLYDFRDPERKRKAKSKKQRQREHERMV